MTQIVKIYKTNGLVFFDNLDNNGGSTQVESYDQQNMIMINTKEINRVSDYVSGYLILSTSGTLEIDILVGKIDHNSSKEQIIYQDNSDNDIAENGLYDLDLYLKTLFS